MAARHRPCSDEGEGQARADLREQLPVAIIGNFSLYQGTDGTLVGCERFRNLAIEAIRAMNPSAVIIAERTTLVYSEPSHVLFTPLQWQLSLDDPAVEDADDEDSRSCRTRTGST